MAFRHPSSIGVGYLIVEPDERAAGGPPSEGHRLPVQAVRRLVIRVGPVDDREFWKAEPWRDDLVRVRHPRCRPDQVAAQRQKPASVIRIESAQQRIAAPIRLVSRGAVRGGLATARPGAEGDQRSVYIKKDYWAVGGAEDHWTKVSPALPTDAGSTRPDPTADP